MLPRKKFKNGTRVQVARNASTDADVVAGRIGKVVNDDGMGSTLVRFTRWAKGHGEGRHSWYIDPRYLTRVKVSRRA